MSKALHTYAELEADLPWTEEGEDEPGQALVDHLARELGAEGVSASFEDSGFGFDSIVNFGGQEYHVAVGVNPTTQRRWVSCTRSRSLFDKLRGRSFDEEHRTLLLALARGLERYPSVTSVRWIAESAIVEEDVSRSAYYDSPVAQTPVRGRLPPRTNREAFQDVAQAYFRTMPWLWFATMGFAIVILGMGYEELWDSMAGRSSASQ